jgi:GMP synthase-like glutamine amidotransferase
VNTAAEDLSRPPLRVGLLQCGHVHDDLVAEHGDYPELFITLLGPHGAVVEAFDVQVAPPPPVEACDAWVISGSADSAYDPLDWVAALEIFLRAAVTAGAPMVAICFGHQLLAQALGGCVERADSWGAGAHDYRIVGPIPGSSLTVGGTVRLVASHQDQVTVLPDDAELVLATDHCPIAGYTIGSTALAIQPHPEYDLALSGALTPLRRERMGGVVTDAALASLGRPLDQASVAAAMVAFLRAAVRPN